MAVADALVSKVLEMLISGIFTQAEQKLKLVLGVQKEVKMLTHNLQSVQAVLIDAEKRQLKEETVKLWLQRLKNISYDIDDVLDEWSTEILKSKIEGDEYEYALKPKRAKVWSFVLSSCFCFHEVGFRHGVAVKIKELYESLDVLSREKDRWIMSPALKGNENAERAMTSSVVNGTEVRRREDDENAVLNLLLAESKRIPHVISVVGMGGIGKTTLAKLMFNEDRVKSHFDTRIWVCVSDPFDEIRIAKAILESLKGSAPNLVEWQSIVDQIQQCIERKKFLLVLDDVWNEDAKKWRQIEDFLKCGSLGSKILVTTRKENVANIMGCRDIIRLGLLPYEECWSIFSESTRTELSSPLVEIGRKIVARCKGLPLAVKTMGGLLSFKVSVEEWQSVLDSDLWELEEVESDVLAPLMLSYYDLSSALKQCFLYCVIFPKDHSMSKKKLIGMWMSQGYLRATRSKDIMEIGEEYFQNLVMRSLFQDFEEDPLDKSYSYCKMHDLVHDLCESLMKKESYSIEVNSTTNRIEDFEEDLSSNQIRHVGISVVGQSGDLFPSYVYNFKTLRSLIILSAPSDSMIRKALPCIFNELTFLRSLSLRGCGIEEVPPNISELIHLRELDLSKNRKLKKLPETICKLYNLQTLVLDYCGNLQSLPQGMGKLINLDCLYNLGCSFLWLPKGIGRLSDLRRLSWLNIGHDNEREEACLSLRDVENLNNLGGFLCIEWSRQHIRDVDVKDATQAQLKAKKHLTYLGLVFSREDVDVKKHLTDLGLHFSDETEDGGEWRKEGGDEELLEALEPHPNLKYLDVYHYKGVKISSSTSWITWKLNSLRKLILSFWINCEQLPALGKLPSLESLTITYFGSVKKVGGEFLGMDGGIGGSGSGSGAAVAMNTALILFPKLIELEFSSMGGWEEWNYEEDEIIKNRMKIMPVLHSLTLHGCPQLKKLPHYITQNTSLKPKIHECPGLH